MMVGAVPNADPGTGADLAASPRIVWHFGFQKTGTTSLQARLWRNRPVVARSTALFHSWDPATVLRHAAVAYCEKPNAENTRALEVEIAAIADRFAASGHQHALVTDENVLGYRLYDAQGDIFTNTERLLPIIERAAAPFASEFVFYTRDMKQWLRSAYNQEVKQMRLAVAFDEWLENIPFEQDWAAQEARLQKTVSAPVTFRDMYADRNDKGPMGAFIMARAGIDTDTQAAMTPPKGRNESLGPAALEFMRQLNATPISDKDLARVRRVVMTNPELFAGGDND